MSFFSVPLVEADLSYRHALKRAIQRHDIAAAIHVAAHAYGGESVYEPRRYFHNNVTNTLDLLGALLGSRCPSR
jgi:UDP-glucose 4-epimerase